MVSIRFDPKGFAAYKESNKMKCKTCKQAHPFPNPQGCKANGHISLLGDGYGFVKHGRGESLCLQGSIPTSDKE